MIVVSDTSPLNYLILIGQVEVLPILFGRVATAPAVLVELSHDRAPLTVSSWAVSPPGWLEVASPSDLQDLGLGRGETEAICLAKEMGADAVLIDERKGVITATNLGLPVTGTLGVLELASRRDLVDLRAAIAELERTTFRAKKEVLEELLRRDAARKR